jgi:excisionase family DNA binding protein
MNSEIGTRRGRPRNQKRPNVPFQERPTCTVAEACDAVGLGKTKFYELLGTGAVETLSVGRRRLVRVPSLLRFLGHHTPEH